MVQAAVGIAFSIGFIIGPLIGAYFSMKAKDQEGFICCYSLLNNL